MTSSTNTIKYFLNRYCIPFCLILFATLQPGLLFSQTHIKGRIINVRDGKPIAYTSVGIVKRKAYVQSDAYGNFKLTIDNIKSNDSIFITSVGYKVLKLSFNDALLKNEFAFYEHNVDLQPVVLKSYLNEDTT